MSIRKIAIATALLAKTNTTAFAEINITWWHAIGGQLGETVNKRAA